VVAAVVVVEVWVEELAKTVLDDSLSRMEDEEALAGSGWLAAVPDSPAGCGCSTETGHAA
jgi:hypothetical protein